MVSLVVTDLDGTLWNRDATIERPTADALDELDRRGVPVLVATGRRWRLVADRLGALGRPYPAVTMNGAHGRVTATGEVFHRVGFDGGTALALLDVLAAHGISPCVYLDHPDLDAVVGPGTTTSAEHVAYLGRWLGRVDDLGAAVHDHPVLNLGVFGVRDGEATEALVAAAAAIESAGLGAAVVSQDVLWGGHSLQIAPPSISKWDGVLAWCARAGLDPGSVVAIGDGANDVELLANAAVGVAMATGDPAALAVADHVVEQWADLLSLLRLPP